jgi:hypothetical protein
VFSTPPLRASRRLAGGERFGKAAGWVVIDPTNLVNMKPLQATPFVVRAEPGRQYDAGVLGIQDAQKPYSHEAE